MPTYRIDDFLRTADIYIAPEIQHRDQYPFTMQDAQSFFHHFRGILFEVNTTARAIFIFRAKEALPRSSFAEGALYSQNVDELEAYAQRNNGNLPEPVAAILFEFGGNHAVPYIKVNARYGFVFTTTDSRDTASTVGATEALKFNGLYFCDNLDSHGYNRYLRFYKSGEVIFVLSNGKPGNVVRWFHKDHDVTTTKGRYGVNGRDLHFTLVTPGPNGWNRMLAGQISGDSLQLVDEIGLSYMYQFFRDDALTNCTRVLSLDGEITEASLKEAYRATIAKYQPDNFQHLSDEFRQMAAQKAKEINEAYDFIREHYSLD